MLTVKIKSKNEHVFVCRSKNRQELFVAVCKYRVAKTTGRFIVVCKYRVAKTAGRFIVVCTDRVKKSGVYGFVSDVARRSQKGGRGEKSRFAAQNVQKPARKIKFLLKLRIYMV